MLNEYFLNFIWLSCLLYRFGVYPFIHPQSTNRGSSIISIFQSSLTHQSKNQSPTKPSKLLLIFLLIFIQKLFVHFLSSHLNNSSDFWVRVYLYLFQYLTHTHTHNIALGFGFGFGSSDSYYILASGGGHLDRSNTCSLFTPFQGFSVDVNPCFCVDRVVGSGVYYHVQNWNRKS